MAAVLARKKQEEEQKARKLQQIEEDRMMTEELHKQRLEREVCDCVHATFAYAEYTCMTLCSMHMTS